MPIEITNNKFICKECPRQLCRINESLFNNGCDDKSLCVICRMKEGKILTESEVGGLGLYNTNFFSQHSTLYITFTTGGDYLFIFL